MGVDALRQLPQGIGGRSISIRSVLTSLLCAYWVLLGLSTLLGKSPLFDWTTAILTSTLCFVLVTFLQIARNRAFAQAVVIAFFFLVFVLPRIFQYQVLPDLIEFPYGDPNLQDINDGLTYLLFGTICIIAGILSVEGLISEGRRRSRSSPKILNLDRKSVV